MSFETDCCLPNSLLQISMGIWRLGVQVALLTADTTTTVSAGKSAHGRPAVPDIQRLLKSAGTAERIREVLPPLPKTGPHQTKTRQSAAIKSAASRSMHSGRKQSSMVGDSLSQWVT
jgi:hypothetical protein